MSLVTTMGRYCFIKCDGPDCARKIEHVDPEQVKRLAGLCDWEGSGDQWMCPDCTERLSGNRPPGKRRGRSVSRRERPGIAR